MDKTLEALFNEWLENGNTDAPEYTAMLDQYDTEEYLSIARAVVEEQKLAFSSGFRTAVQLLVGGVL